jgi:hypothetical protein
VGPQADLVDHHRRHRDGVAGSLIAPWVQLAVENRRETRTHRRRSIEIWRAMVGRHMSSGTRVIQDVDYVSLRGYLRPEILKQLEQSSYSITIRDGAEGISANSEISALTEEVDRLEREWELA